MKQVSNTIDYEIKLDSADEKVPVMIEYEGEEDDPCSRGVSVWVEAHKSATIIGDVDHGKVRWNVWDRLDEYEQAEILNAVAEDVWSHEDDMEEQRRVDKAVGK
jgi:hypothetical protein